MLISRSWIGCAHELCRHAHACSLYMSGKLSRVGRLRPTACGSTLGKKGGRRVFLCCFISVFASFAFCHHIPSVCARRSVWSPAPPSFLSLEDQIVHFEIWLTCFRYDIRPLFYTQPPAQFLDFTAGFKHQQLSFSRLVVCATCAHRHIALQNRGMREI